MTKIFNIAHQNGFMYMMDPNEVWKTVASNNPELNNLPKLPPIEEDIQAPRYVLEEGQINGVRALDHYKGFIEGYKAASKKKYTEEDIRRAMIRASEWTYFKGTNVTGLVEFITEYLQSLNPLPKQVEISIQYIDTIGGEDQYLPEIIDGFVTIKRWIYE